MIIHLSGTLDRVTEDYIILDVQGVGYQVFMPASDMSEMPDVGMHVKVHTVHHIREDSQQLFGFKSHEGRELFLVLTSVSGVGPKIAIKMLSTMATDQMIQAIVREDLAVLTQVPGVGKKMAERLILDLRDKLPKMYTVDLSHRATARTSNSPVQKDIETDIVMAMKTLGYSADEVKHAIQRASDKLTTDMGLEECIKIVLKHLF